MWPLNCSCRISSSIFDNYGRLEMSGTHLHSTYSRLWLEVVAWPQPWLTCVSLFYCTDSGESLQSRGFLTSRLRGTHWPSSMCRRYQMNLLGPTRSLQRSLASCKQLVRRTPGKRQKTCQLQQKNTLASVFSLYSSFFMYTLVVFKTTIFWWLQSWMTYI